MEFCLNTPLLFLSPFIYLPIFTHSLALGSFTSCLFPDGTVGAGLLDLPLTHYSSWERSLTSLGIAFLIYKVDLIHRAVVKGSAHGKVSKMLTLVRICSLPGPSVLCSSGFLGACGSGTWHGEGFREHFLGKGVPWPFGLPRKKRKARSRPHPPCPGMGLPSNFSTSRSWEFAWTMGCRSEK